MIYIADIVILSGILDVKADVETIEKANFYEFQNTVYHLYFV